MIMLSLTFPEGEKVGAGYAAKQDPLFSSPDGTGNPQILNRYLICLSYKHVLYLGLKDFFKTVFWERGLG